MQCPDCEKPLVLTTAPVGNYFLCSQCAGRLYGVAIMKRLLSGGVFQNLWNESQAAAASGICPECRNPAPQVPCDTGAHRFEVRLCRTCQATWIPGRFSDDLPAAFREKKREPLAGLSREDRIAHAEALAGTAAVAHKKPAAQNPEELWKWPLGVLGFAVRFTPAYVPTPAYACYALAGLAILATWFWSDALQTYGFVPTHPLANGGITLATSIFLHGGILHLISNLYYLLTFGPELESRIGWLKFTAIFFLAAWAGIALHAVLDPRTEIPLIGASGGIAGVLTLYAATFPKTRVGIFIWLWPVIFRWFAFPVVFAIPLWLAQQLMGSMRQISGFDHISYLAHLGGAVTIGVVYLVRRFVYPGAFEKSSMS